MSGCTSLRFALTGGDFTPEDTRATPLSNTTYSCLISYPSTSENKQTVYNWMSFKYDCVISHGHINLAADIFLTNFQHLFFFHNYSKNK
jgi:hypothetical protein